MDLILKKKRTQGLCIRNLTFLLSRLVILSPFNILMNVLHNDPLKRVSGGSIIAFSSIANGKNARHLVFRT